MSAEVTQLIAESMRLKREVERLTAERDEARKATNRMHVRAQAAEAQIATTIEDCKREGVSFGRMLANSGFRMVEERAENAEAERDAALRDVAILRPAAAHAERAEAELRALREGVEALVGECASSDCIHLNDMWGRLRALLSDGPSA